jgi:hypothetical protein
MRKGSKNPSLFSSKLIILKRIMKFHALVTYFKDLLYKIKLKPEDQALCRGPLRLRHWLGLISHSSPENKHNK